VTIELHGLEIFGFHGVLEDERSRGQRFLVDLALEVERNAAARAGASDRIEDAVDYRDVVETVREISDARAYRLLESLATALADRLVERFPVTQVQVRVRKPDVLLAAPVEHAAVVVERRR
jgi:7,8-dihydroneopterin aldolase/epimerase/oxygenase